jgi:hypothetical protein
VVAALVCFTQPVESVLNAFPGLGAVRWARSESVLELAVAVLAGVGLDVLIRHYRERAVLRLFEALFAAAGLAVFAIWAARPREGPVRAHNLLWAGGGVALALVVFAALDVSRARAVRGEGRRRGISRPERRGLRSPGLWAAVLLVVCQSAFLVVMGSSQWSSNSTSFTATPAVVELQRAVGSSLVAFGTPACRSDATPGIPPNINIVYGVRELAAYDPMLPRRYYQAWVTATGTAGGYPSESRYCPGVTSVALARRYGVSFVLESHGARGPKGTVFDTTIGNEDLYRVPGSALATLVRSPGGHPPVVDARGTAVAVTHPEARSWRVVTDGTRPEVLRLRLTDVPGWHATIDGRALPLEQYAGVMLQAQIPSGRHVMVLSYWPTELTVGIGLAIISGLALAMGLVLGLVSRRRMSRSR